MLHLFSDTYSNISGRLTTKEVGGCQYLNWVSYSRAYKTFLRYFVIGEIDMQIWERKNVWFHIFGLGRLHLRFFCAYGEKDDVRKFVYKNKFIFVYFTLESFTFHIHIMLSCFMETSLHCGIMQRFYIKGTHFLLCTW